MWHLYFFILRVQNFIFRVQIFILHVIRFSLRVFLQILLDTLKINSTFAAVFEGSLSPHLYITPFLLFIQFYFFYLT